MTIFHKVLMPTENMPSNATIETDEVYLERKYI